MIHIQTIRLGLLIVAITTNDDGDATAALGLTRNAAERRLCRKAAR